MGGTMFNGDPSLFRSELVNKFAVKNDGDKVKGDKAKVKDGDKDSGDAAKKAPAPEDYILVEDSEDEEKDVVVMDLDVPPEPEWPPKYVAVVAKKLENEEMAKKA